MAALLTSCWDVLVHWVASSFWGTWLVTSYSLSTGSIPWDLHHLPADQPRPGPSSLKPSLSKPTGPEPSLTCLLQCHRSFWCPLCDSFCIQYPCTSTTDILSCVAASSEAGFFQEQATDSSWNSFSLCCNTSGPFLSFPSLLAQW